MRFVCLHRSVFIISSLALLLCFTESCSIQKRKYRKGYHTEVPAKPTTVEVKKTEPYPVDSSSVSSNGDTTKYLSSPFLNDAPSDTITQASTKQHENTKPQTPNDTSGCDKIYLKNGKEKMVHVTGTDPDEIKYRECGDKDGIIYGISKKEVLMVKRSDGTYDVISTNASDTPEQPVTQPVQTAPRNDDNILNDRFFWFMIRVVLGVFL